MSRRLERVISTLQQSVQRVLAKGLSDPRARGLITVTEVNVAEDLRTATIFISVLPEKHQDLTLHALRHAARHIRRETGELMAMHTLPEFDFRLDSRLKQQAAVFDALARAREATPGLADPTEPEPPQPDRPGPTPRHEQHNPGLRGTTDEGSKQEQS